MTTLPARPEAISFSPQQSALIVVDMQNAYASPGGYLDLAGFDVSATREVIENINTAVTAAREAGMLIIWFQNGWDDQYVEAGGPGSPNFHKSNALKTMRKRPELQGKLLAKGGWDYQLVDALVPQAGDIVLPKPRYSGFFNTPRTSRCSGDVAFNAEVVVIARLFRQRAALHFHAVRHLPGADDHFAHAAHGLGI
jgi:ureidoacrylate peracid hydrolase